MRVQQQQQQRRRRRQQQQQPPAHMIGLANSASVEAKMMTISAAGDYRECIGATVGSEGPVSEERDEMTAVQGYAR